MSSRTTHNTKIILPSIFPSVRVSSPFASVRPDNRGSLSSIHLSVLCETPSERNVDTAKQDQTAVRAIRLRSREAQDGEGHRRDQSDH
ncbi:unnamed protein product [Jaminaea pallidilutea]